MNKVIIFGAGCEGKQLYELVKYDTAVKCFWDNNPQFWKQNEFEIPVCKPSIESFSNEEDTVLIGSRKNRKEIEKELSEIGIKNSFSSDRFLVDWAFKGREKIKRIMLMNTHGGVNCGDHLISIAEHFFLNKYFGGYGVVEISSDMWIQEQEYIKSHIRLEDILLISGGGYIGTLWMSHGEENVRQIINCFPQNRIVILPQTLYFDDSRTGRTQALITKYSYEKGENLTVCLRERNSYQKACDLFNNSIKKLLMPDMSLILDRTIKGVTRTGALICFRDDIESSVKPDTEEIVIEVLKKHDLSIKKFNMKAGCVSFFNQRNSIIEEKIRIIQRSRIVVTDRLHCMVMCVITGTPCVAFDNLTRKVSGVYRWIEDNEYIRIVNDIESMKVSIEELLNIKIETNYKHKRIDALFEKLAKNILNIN